MDYYQGVVMEYLRANRSIFLNPEFLLSLAADTRSAGKGEHWYVDILALSMKERVAYLCEVSYSVHVSAMRGRLAAWAGKWNEICATLQRDAGIGSDWSVRPWLFATQSAIDKYLLPKLPLLMLPVAPKITPLEMTAPWLFPTWDHPSEHPKPGVPEQFW